MATKIPFATANTRPFSENLQDGLTRDRLIQACEDFACSFRKSMNKKDLAKCLETKLLKDPRTLAERIPLRDLLQLQKLVHAGGYLQTEEPLLFSVLESNWIVMAPTDENSTEYMDEEFEDFFHCAISENLRQALLPVIDDFVKDPFILEMDRKEQMIRGLITLYGVLSIKQLVRIIVQMTDEKLEEKDILNLFHFRMELKMEIMPFFYKNDLCFAHESMDDPSLFYAKVLKRKDLDYAIFPIDYVLLSTEPISIFQHPSADLLIHLLGEKNKDDQMIAYFQMFLIWQAIQSDIKLTEIISMVSETTEWHSMDEINRFVQALTTFQNGIPHWILKGHIPNDLQKQSPINMDNLFNPFFS